MNKRRYLGAGTGAAAGLALFFLFAGSSPLSGQSLDIPSHRWGISFGNSKEFSGLRFNFRDSRVRRISGINVTLWQPRRDNKQAVVSGISLGVIPGGGKMTGLQVGLLAVAAETKLSGISIGLLGPGSGEDITGINIGGLGAGAGENVKGLSIGGLGVGAGEDIIGINIGGLGAGAGENMVGLNVGGLGIGAGEDIIGINIGGIGVGAGGRVAGINIAGVGAGAGEELVGLTIAGFAAGSVKVRGLTIAGGAVGGQDIKGIHLAIGTVMVTKGGRMSGLAASAFNHIRGHQTGLALGIVNYAYRVRGLQIGLVNIVRDNPRGLKVLPVFNSSF